MWRSARLSGESDPRDDKVEELERLVAELETAKTPERAPFEFRIDAKKMISYICIVSVLKIAVLL